MSIDRKMDKQIEVHLYLLEATRNKKQTWNIMLESHLYWVKSNMKKNTLYDSGLNEVYTRQNHLIVLDIKWVMAWKGEYRDWQQGSMMELSEVMEMFYILIEIVIKWFCIFPMLIIFLNKKPKNKYYHVIDSIGHCKQGP